MPCTPKCPCQEIPVVTDKFRSCDVNYKDIVACADSNCTICSIVRDAPGPFLPRGVTIKPETKVVASLLRSSLLLDFRDVGMKLEIFSRKDTGIPLIPKYLKVPKDRGSPESASFKKAAEWFLECVQNHTVTCSSFSPNNPSLPDRILDIQAWSDSEDIVLREPKNETGYYSCLSHCWGHFQPLTTTTSTLPQRLDRIPFNDLPKTFQDTVTFARRFSFRYLWIDSLCIIQDSLEDWTTQASRMATIYRNAVLTISASGSPGPNYGFLSTTATHIPLSSYTNNPEHVDILIYRSANPHKRSDHPLLSRGWAYQERLLSPRVLHFGAAELVWECMQTMACECSHIQAKHSITGIDDGWFERKLWVHPFMMELIPERTLMNVWYQVVNDFSHMHLTYHTDYLLALAGAAGIVKQGIEAWVRRNRKEEKGEVKYLAGMWSFGFVEGCLWNTLKPEKADRPPSWRAPTFSWAAVHGSGIHWRMAKFLREEIGAGEPFFEGISENDKIRGQEPIKVYAQLVEGKCTPLPGNTELGQLGEGYIVVCAPLLEGRIWFRYLVRDTADVEVLRMREGRKSMFMEQDFRADYNLLNPRNARDVLSDRAQVWFLPLMNFVYERGTRQVFWGLVLRRVGEERERGMPTEDVVVDTAEDRKGLDSNGVYERIGLLKFTHPLKPDIEEALFEDGFGPKFMVKIV